MVVLRTLTAAGLAALLAASSLGLHSFFGGHVSAAEEFAAEAGRPCPKPIHIDAARAPAHACPACLQLLHGRAGLGSVSLALPGSSDRGEALPIPAAPSLAPTPFGLSIGRAPPSD